MDEIVDFKKHEKKRSRAISALIAAAIIIVSGFIIRAKLQNRNTDEDLDYYDNANDTEFGAVM